MEEEAAAHDATIQDIRLKHTRQIEELNDQLEQQKKAKQQLEKAKTALESEKTDIVNELKTAQASKAESEKRRKQAENQLIDVTTRFAELEKIKNDSTEYVNKVQVR